jgi:hypothetical protein
MSDTMSAFARNKEFYALIATIVLAIVGLVGKYINDLAIARRRDRLDRVNMQLRMLYALC